MSEEMLRSGIGSGGERSPRRYTRAEVAAARRIGLAHGILTRVPIPVRIRSRHL